jgi:hypothetical protein
MALLCRWFPALTKLKESDKREVTAVNGGIVEEVLLPLGQLDFGKGMLCCWFPIRYRPHSCGSNLR